MERKCDNKERGLDYEHLLPRVLGYKRSHIKEVDIAEFRVWLYIGTPLTCQKDLTKRKEDKRKGSISHVHNEITFPSLTVV